MTCFSFELTNHLTSLISRYSPESGFEDAKIAMIALHCRELHCMKSCQTIDLSLLGSRWTPAVTV